MKAHIICWDGIEYDRSTDLEEYKFLLSEGVVKELNGKLIYDFSNKPYFLNSNERHSSKGSV